MMDVRDVALQAGLPSSVEHERYVLGSCIADTEMHDTAAGMLQESDFSIERHKLLWSHLDWMRNTGHAVDRVNVAQTLQERGKLASIGGITALLEMDSLPSTAVLPGYCRTLRKAAIRRTAIAEADRLRKLALDGGDSESILAALQRAGELLSGQEINAGGMLDMIGVLQRDFAGEVGQMFGDGATVVQCPMPFGEDILGGLRLGELTIMAARPAVGKSAMAVQIATHVAATGMPVHFWSLEMKAGALLRRAVSSQSGVSFHKITKGYCNQEERRAGYATLASLTSMPLWMCDSPGSSVENIRSELRRASARKECPALVIVDYLQLLNGSGGENRNQEIGKISRGLKRLTLEFPVSILALSQLSRDQEKESNRPPRLSDLRDSGSIEQDADSVVFIHRPGTSVEDFNAPVWEEQWIVAKQRNGQTGVVPVLFYRSRMRFERVERTS